MDNLAVIDVLSNFSNRELSGGFWLLVAAIFLFWKFDLWGTCKELVRIFFSGGLWLLFTGFGVWVALFVVALEAVYLWTSQELKLTVLWFLFSGTSILGRSIQNQDGARYFRQVIRDDFRIIATLEFVVVAYSFSFWVEFWFVPLMTFLGLLLAVSERDPAHKSVKRLLEWVFVGITLFLIYDFIQRTIETKGAIWSISTSREVVLPVLLAVFAVPYCYVVYCYARWQEAQHQINQKTYHTSELRAYARKQFFWRLFFRPPLMGRAIRQFNMLPAKSKSDVRDIIREVYNYEAGRKNPPLVQKEQGWSPYHVETFLDREGLQAGDYHDTGFDDEWGAESQSKYLDNAGLFETLTFRAKGCAGIVNNLQLRGSFKDSPKPDAGIRQMKDVATVLADRATSLHTLPKEIVAGFETQTDVALTNDPHELKLQFHSYGEANILDAEFTISMTK